MTSEIRTNSIKSRTGLSTVSYADTGIIVSGIVTATSFSGDGSNLTGITGTTINNNANNRLITGSGTANTLEAESGLTFDGSQLVIETSAQNNLKINSSNSDGPNIHFERSGTAFAYLGSAAANTGGTATDLALRAQGNLIFATNGGNERLRIDSAGDLGLGVTPDNFGSFRTLHIKGPSNEGAAIRLQYNTDVVDSNDFIIYKHDAAAYLRIQGTDPLIAYMNGAERLRIDSSGRVVIGGTSAYIGGASLAVLGTGTTPNTYGCVAIGRVGANPTSGTALANIRLNGGSIGTRRGVEISAFADSNWSDGSSQPTRLTIGTTENGQTSSTERLRIDSSGNMYMGTVDGSMWNNTDAGHGWSWMQMYGCVATKTDRASGYSNMYLNKTNTGSGTDERWISFGWNAGDYGNIRKSGNGVNYQSNSDYRLKENVVSLNDGISRLKNLKPSRFNWKSEPGVTVDGFIAHEAQTVVPESVDGIKDQIADNSNVDMENGTPIYQKMDNSKLIPLLTAALQELITKVETLEAKVATLEGS